MTALAAFIEELSKEEVIALVHLIEEEGDYVASNNDLVALLEMIQGHFECCEGEEDEVEQTEGYDTDLLDVEPENVTAEQLMPSVIQYLKDNESHSEFLGVAICTWSQFKDLEGSNILLEQLKENMLTASEMGVDH